GSRSERPESRRQADERSTAMKVLQRATDAVVRSGQVSLELRPNAAPTASLARRYHECPASVSRLLSRLLGSMKFRPPNVASPAQEREAGGGQELVHQRRCPVLSKRAMVNPVFGAGSPHRSSVGLLAGCSQSGFLVRLTACQPGRSVPRGRSQPRSDSR